MMPLSALSTLSRVEPSGQSTTRNARRSAHFCASVAISARRQVHSAFVDMRVPFMNMNGSGRNELLGSEAYVGTGGTLHVVPPPVPAWLTVTVCEATPAAETVTRAVRAAVPVFCCAVIVPVPLFEPEAGLTVSQSWLSARVQPVLDVMGELLEALGQDVETALGGVSGIEAAKRGRPDVVFTDLGMPVANGWEVASEVKKHSPATLVVMVTGWGVQLEPDSARERGVDYILPKPYTLDEVKRILTDISQRRRAA